MRNLLFAFVFIFLSACSKPTFTYQTASHELSFKMTPTNTHTIRLNAPQKQINHDSCSLYSYTLQDTSSKYGRLFVEEINLASDCKFNADALGFFMYEFKNELKLKSLKRVEEQQFNNYEFLTYSANDGSYFNVIHIFSVFKEVFIVDYQGTLSSELLNKFDTTYTSQYANSKRFKSAYHSSLVRKNILNDYFTKEYEDFN